MVDHRAVDPAGVAGRGYRSVDRRDVINGILYPQPHRLLVAVVVHAADVQDRYSGEDVLLRMVGYFTRLKLIWADGEYAGEFVRDPSGTSAALSRLSNDQA